MTTRDAKDNNEPFIQIQPRDFQHMRRTEGFLSHLLKAFGKKRGWI